jgi:hypothetical protein
MKKNKVFFLLALCLIVSGSRKVQREMGQNHLPGEEFHLDFRLVDVGDTITFTLSGVAPDDRLEIFPRYLER